MLSAKAVVISFICIVFSYQVEASTLQCKSSFPYDYFTATIDDNEGYFELKDAKVRVGYATANNLSCVGSNVKSKTSCVGHWFNLPDFVVEFQIEEIDGKLIGVISNLKKGKFTTDPDEKIAIGEGMKFDCNVE
ncbi:hypothetical protein [Bdellovibrio sp. HCB274]|uniref:hypothetical protein n=1 Tax=Bdellovibrio sp. HCB274 TaxID=3394361 RepID=UPI0039B655FB